MSIILHDKRLATERIAVNQDVGYRKYRYFKIQEF